MYYYFHYKMNGRRIPAKGLLVPIIDHMENKFTGYQSFAFELKRESDKAFFE